MYKTRSLLPVLLLSCFSLIAQELPDLVSVLPPTLEVTAPEFKTVSRYNLNLDTIHNHLYIQDIRTSKEGTLHFYQWLYELPLNNLVFEARITEEDQIEMAISSGNPKTNFISYWFQDNKVSSIQNRDEILLGKWENVGGNFETIDSYAKQLTRYMKDFNSEVSKEKKPNPGSFKYTASNVTRMNLDIDNDLMLGNYHFTPFYDEQKNPRSGKLTGMVQKRIRREKLDPSLPVPVIAYSNAAGEIENILLINSKYDYPLIISPSDIKPFNTTSRATKNLLLLK